MRGPDKKTPFHLAVISNSVNCLEYLCQTMDDLWIINDPDLFGKSPLHYAVERSLDVLCSNVRSIGILFSAGALVNVRNADGDTPLHVFMRLIHANLDDKSVKKVLTSLKFFMRNDTIDFEAKNRMHETPEEILDKEKVKFNDLGVPFINCINDLHRTPTVKSSEYYLSRAVETVLLEGSDHDLLRNLAHVGQLNSIGNVYLGTKTLVYLVTERYNAHTLNVLLEVGFNAFCPNLDDEKLPLHAAAQKCDHEMMLILLKSIEARSHKSFEHNISVQSSFEVIQTLLCNFNSKFNENNICLSLFLEKVRGFSDAYIDRLKSYSHEMYASTENFSLNITDITRYANEINDIGFLQMWRNDGIAHTVKGT